MEFSQSVADIVKKTSESYKKLMHKDITVKTEISGGTWDTKTNTYVLTDENSRVTTEYKLKAHNKMKTGYSVQTQYFKDLPDASGTPTKTEVKFDDMQSKWVKAKGSFALKDLRPKKKMMGTIIEHKGSDNLKSTYTLIVEPAKYVDRPLYPVPPIYPPNPPSVMIRK